MYFRKYSFLFFFCVVLVSCMSDPKPKIEPDPKRQISIDEIDLQGHRGCRGLMPENTLAGYLSALDLGVNTLEMDVVITEDDVVICSHEPWFSHEISLDPSGNEISLEEERSHAIYDLSFEETGQYDVGKKVHPRFPDQEKMAATKPRLQEVITRCDAHADETGRPLPFYNIETKCTPQGDSIYHPPPAQFADLILAVIDSTKIADRAIIQSFDVRSLQYIHRIRPGLKLALLVENTLGAEANIDLLGFDPDIYSPDYTLVDSALISFCGSRKMELIPWTVNELDAMKELLAMGVDGLISDFPNLYSQLPKEINVYKP